MKINEFFEKEYLVVGNTYDNFIFENCPKEFLALAKKSLSKCDGEVKPCVVSLNREQEKRVEKTLNNCSEEFQKKILARDFISALVVKELFKYQDKDQLVNDFLNLQIDAFLKNDFDLVKNLHIESYMPYEIKKIAKEIGKIELSFILCDTQNIYLQQAINIFISSREPYSVKIFTSNERLSTYYDMEGNIIECPHDFMRRDVNNFIEHENESTKEQ